MSKRKNRLSKKDKRLIKKAVLASAKKSGLAPNDLTYCLTLAFERIKNS